MKKYPIGFNTRINKEPENNKPMEVCKGVIEPKKSVVQVYFPHRGMGWAYYNDSFDLNVGDFVYVEGKLEGYRGQVTEVNYSFKIKLSDYKKVIAVKVTSSLQVHTLSALTEMQFLFQRFLLGLRLLKMMRIM